MSNHSHLLADVRKAARTPRASRPHDQFTKDQLWTRLQAAEAALKAANSAAQRTAAMAHGYAQSETAATRRKFFALRDAAYEARDASSLQRDPAAKMDAYLRTTLDQQRDC